jgi:hypothetical protein
MANKERRSLNIIRSISEKRKKLGIEPNVANYLPQFQGLEKKYEIIDDQLYVRVNGKLIPHEYD